MDVYIEHIVKRKKSILDIITAVMIVLIGLGLIYLAGFLAIFPVIMLLLVAAIVYVTYKFVMRINTEYEYIITNGELDVDRIINKRTRKKIETVNLRLIEDFSKGGIDKESRYLSDKSIKKIIVCENVREGYYYLVYTQDDKRKILFFTPTEEMTEHIRKVNPGKFQ